MEAWASGGLAATFETEFIARSAAAQGACSVYDQLANLQYADLETELSDEE